MQVLQHTSANMQQCILPSESLPSCKHVSGIQHGQHGICDCFACRVNGSKPHQQHSEHSCWSAVAVFCCLQHLDISRNSLTGELPNQVTILGGLKSLLISHNKFTGTLSEDVFYLPLLLTLDVSHNLFVGTIPEAIG